MKFKLQFKYKKEHLRIGYMSFAHNTIFGKYNLIQDDCIIKNCILNDFTYVSNRSQILNSKIGKFTSIGPDVKIAPGNHPTRTIVSTHPSIYSNPENLLKNFMVENMFNFSKKTIIGNDVWICSGAVISDGVTISDGAIIMANSVVTKDVEPYAIVGGIPAVFIRQRFEQEKIDFLMKFKWWDKEISWIENNNFLMLDVEKLFEKYK